MGKLFFLKKSVHYSCTAVSPLKVNQHKSEKNTEDGRSRTTFYYCSVNHQSRLMSNKFSKLSYIFLIHQNVPQIMSFHLRVYDGFIGQNILKL